MKYSTAQRVDKVMELSQLLSGIPRAWVLCETKFQVALTRKLLAEKLPAHQHSVFTVGDAVFYALSRTCAESRLSPKTLTRLGSQESLSVILSLLRRDQAQFPLLNQSLKYARAATGTFPYPIQSLRTLFGSVRLNRTEESLIASVIDRFGNTRDDKKRGEEVLYLLGAYQTFQRETLRFDDIGLVELFLEFQNNVPTRKLLQEKVLPETVILQRPTHLFPLEELLWSGLGKITRLQICVDEEILCHEPGEFMSTPSLRFPSRLAQFLTKHVGSVESMPMFSPSRRPLVSYLFDRYQPSAELSASVQGITVWSCEERRDEVQRAVNRIHSSVQEGRAKPEDFQLIALNLDPYYELLLQECRRVSLEVSLPKGIPLRVTSTAMFFFAYLKWLLSPSIRAACNFFSSKLIRPRRSTESASEAFFNRYQAVIENILGKLEAKQTFATLAASIAELKPDVLERFYARHGLSLQLRESPDWAMSAFECWLRSVQADGAERNKTELLLEFCSFFGSLSALDEELQFAWGISARALHPESRIRLLRERFFSMRRPFSEFRSTSNDREFFNTLVITAQAYRRIQQICRQVQKYFVFRSEYLLEDCAHITLANCVGEILHESENSFIRAKWGKAQREQSGVPITELLDARSVYGKSVIVLGVMAENFPPQEVSTVVFGTELDAVAARIEQQAGTSQNVFEAYWLFSHLLRNSNDLVLSYARQSETGETQPAAVLTMIAALTKTGTISARRDKPAARTAGISDEQRSYRSVHLNRGSELLQARFGHMLSAFDGYLSDEDWKENSGQGGESQRVSAAGTNRYSTTGLETLSDCPQRFFFREVLGLEEAGVSLIEEVRKVVGNIVHRSLAIFFETGRNPLFHADEDLFYEACLQMQEIANGQFEKSEIDWNGHPLFRAEKDKVLLGLAERGDRGKRGYLKAALVFQRELLPTMPSEVEYRFGSKSKEALLLEREGQNIAISGTIDRIDRNSEEQVAAVWDYKTGRAPRLFDVEGGRSLQIPLYAKFIQDKIAPYRLPARGGIIALEKPNRRDEDLSHPRYGVLVEHLALRRGGNELVPSAAEERVKQAIDRVFMLDSLVRAGKFHQIEDTRACAICEFQQVCGRNEAVLHAKLQGNKLEVKKRKEESDFTPTFVKIPALLQSSAEQLAASQIETSMAVVAGAGSGKTFVLRNRILRLLLQGEPFSSILAITFTEKAAAEILVRLELAIWKLLEEKTFEGRTLSEEELSRLSEAKAFISEAGIGTIHSFCARVIGMDPELSPVAFQGKIISGGRQEEYLAEAASSLFAENQEVSRLTDTILRAGLSYQLLVVNLKRLVRTPRVLDDLSRSLGEGGGAKELIENLKQEQREDTHQQLTEWITEWMRELGVWLNSDYVAEELTTIQREHFANLSAHAKAFLETQPEKSDAANVDPWYLHLKALLDYTEAQYSSAKRKSKANPRNFWKELRDYLSEMPVALLQLNSEREEQALSLAAQICRLSFQVLRRYREIKEEAGVVDFDDLVSACHTMLCTKQSGYLRERQAGLFRRLQTSIRHILIDEFQDTDNCQWDILRVVVGLGSNDEEFRTVFVVGDGKQAIYGFRGGDVRVFRRAMNEISGHGGTIVSLHDNYRSNKGVIAFINAFFDALLRVDFSDGKERVMTAIDPQEMRSMREDIEESSSRVSLLLLSGNEDGTNNEADQVAKFICHVLDEESNSYAALRQSPAGPKIAVLTRSVKQLLQVAQALESTHVAFSISHSNGFFELDEILQFENLFRWLADQSDFISLIGVLRSPLFGLSDGELLRLYRELDGKWEDINSPGAGELREYVREALLRWREMAAVCSNSKLLELVAEEIGLSEIYDRGDKSEAFKNIERLIDLMRMAELEGELANGAFHVLCWLEERKREGLKAPNANLTSHDVVLMTIHGAKGLEFPMVILPFLDARGHRDQDFVLGQVGRGGEYLTLLGVRIEDEEDSYRREKTFVSELIEGSAKALRSSEERRIFYVGCTRARDYLVLSLKERSLVGKEIAGSEEERRDQMFQSDSPAVWVRNILRCEEEAAPTEFRLSTRNGEVLRIPVIRS